MKVTKPVTSFFMVVNSVSGVENNFTL
jgi:hypothetical protein